MSEDLDDIFGDEGEAEASGEAGESGDISLDADLEAALGDAGEGEAGGESEEGGGMSLDTDLEAALGDAGEGEAGGESEEGEGMSLDADLESMLGDTADIGGGEEAEEGEGMSLDADLESMLGDSADIGGAEVGGGASGAAAASVLSEDGLTVSKATLSNREAVNLDFLLDVMLDCTFEVGRSQMMISDLLTLGQGSVVELHRLVGEELDLLINGKLIAKGEVVVVNEKFGCRITEIISPHERIKHLATF